MNLWKRAVTFLSEVRSEWKQTYTPGMNQVVTTTIVVVVASFIFAIYLWIADLVIVWARQGLYGLVS